MSNGAIKKSRKRRNAAAVSGSGRGRPRKAFVAMYHSQISGDKNTIKIRIKKSNFSPIQVVIVFFFSVGNLFTVNGFVGESTEKEEW